MNMSLSLVAVASLTGTGGQNVAGYLDGEQRAKLFINSSGTPLNGIANSLPVTVSTTQISQVDSAGNTKTGGWKVVINSAAADTTNFSSPQTVFVDQDAWFLVASTSNG
jgi:hypothetical protein